MSRYLAVDADARGLFVASARTRGDRIVLEHAAALEDGPLLSPSTAVTLGARLKDLIRQAGIKPAPVIVSISRDRVILKDIRHPPSPPAEEPAIVRFQAIRDLTESPDDVLMDYLPMEGAPGPDGEKRALAVFVRKEVVLAAKQMCESAGLKLEGITPRPFSAVGALEHAFTSGTATRSEDSRAALAVVTLWDQGGEFTVVRDGAVSFTRSLPAPALANPTTLAAELKRNLTVFAGQNPAHPVEAIYLSEGHEPGAGWGWRLEGLLPVPVHTFDPILDLAEAVPTPVRGRLSGPVGLLTLKGHKQGLPINFVTPRQPKADTGPARTRVLLGALAAILLIGLVGVFAVYELDKAGRRISELTTERDRLDDDLKRYELDAKRLAAADEFTTREVVWLDELYDLADRVPDVSKVTVTEFDGTAIAPTKATPRPGQVVVKDNKPVPVATVRITMRTSNDQFAQKIADAFKNDKYYINTTKTTGGQGDPGSKGQQYVLTAQVVHRPATGYTRRLTVAPPAPPPAPAAPGDGDLPVDGFNGFNGFGGGFAP